VQLACPSTAGCPPACPQPRTACTRCQLNKPFAVLFSLWVPVTGATRLLHGSALVTLRADPSLLLVSPSASPPHGALGTLVRWGLPCSAPAQPGSVSPGAAPLPPPTQKDAGQAAGDEAWGLLRKVSVQGGAPAGTVGPGPPHSHATTEPKAVPRDRVFPPGPWESNTGSVQPCTRAGTHLLRALGVTPVVPPSDPGP